MATTTVKGAAQSGRSRGDTSQRILDVAEALVQTRGFNGFSYADVAEQVGVTTASLHYHFPGKAELGQALVDRYSVRFAQSLARIDTDLPLALDRLEAYVALYAAVLRAKRMCLCGMLAAEYQTLPQSVRGAITAFFDDNESWLQNVLEQGRSEGTLRVEGSARDTARVLISGLEGAMLVARPYGDLGRFELTAARLVSSITEPRAARKSGS